MKWPYTLIDWEWDEMGNGGNLQDAVKYALEQGIKPLLWYNSSTSWLGPGPLYRLNKKECAGCLMCVGFCPENVMVQCDDYLEPSKCTACGLCVKACPTGAIRLVEE